MGKSLLTRCSPRIVPLKSVPTSRIAIQNASTVRVLTGLTSALSTQQSKLGERKPRVTATFACNQATATRLAAQRSVVRIVAVYETITAVSAHRSFRAVPLRIISTEPLQDLREGPVTGVLINNMFRVYCPRPLRVHKLIRMGTRRDWFILHST